jgi:hypothetical protein
MLQGYFVDVGAGDGVFSSNTFFLERQRCWKGIAIEPAASEYPKLERQRPGSTVVSSHLLRSWCCMMPPVPVQLCTGQQLCMRTAGGAAAVTFESCSQSTMLYVLQVRPAAMALAATQLNRSISLLVHGAVCEKDGYKLFQDVTLDGHWTGWSGFRDTFDQHHAHQVHRMLLLSPDMLSLSQL